MIPEITAYGFRFLETSENGFIVFNSFSILEHKALI